jgi:hypothetical protein
MGSFDFDYTGYLQLRLYDESGGYTIIDWATIDVTSLPNGEEIMISKVKCPDDKEFRVMALELYHIALNTVVYHRRFLTGIGILAPGQVWQISVLLTFSNGAKWVNEPNK